MEFLQLNKGHFNTIINLSNVAFGVGFTTKETLLKHVQSATKIGLVAVYNQQVVGYLLSDILPQKLFVKEILSEKKWFDDATKEYTTVGLIKQVAVHPKHQKKGIANQLIQYSLELSQKKVIITYCLAWKKGKNTALKHLLLRNSFSYQTTIKNYWKKDSLKKAYQCIFCGVPPCKCATEVYFKKNAPDNSDAL